MTDYSKTIIYKIHHAEKPDLIYVGHTTNFIKRKSYHKYASKESESKLYKMIRENGGFECFNMVPIMEYPCESEIQATIQEEKCRLELSATMNSIGCIYNPDLIKANKKVYRIKNKEMITESNKLYYENHKEKRKEYRESIKESQKEIWKAWREKHKERLRELKNTVETCSCGLTYTHSNKSQHLKSKAHANKQQEA